MGIPNFDFQVEQQSSHYVNGLRIVNLDVNFLALAL
jgi:hypothetical protein